ncbi:MAG: tail fiber domain-containing protein [Acidobacteriota bacterium]
MSRIPASPRFALLAFALVAAPSLGQLTPDHRSIHSVSAEGDTLVARFVESGYVKGTLVVSGEGVFISSDFDASETGAVRLVDADGAPLADGSYRWELRLLVPSPTEAEPDRVAMKTSAGSLRLNGGLLQLPQTRIDVAATENPSGLQTISSAANSGGEDFIVNLTATAGADDGGLCVGFDCSSPTETFPDIASTDDESWIVMEGEQTGLRFDDTGGAGASTDWQILANGPDAAGADELTFDDLTNAVTPLTLTANAGDNSIFVGPENTTPADRGAARVGIGTSTPEDDINVTIQGGASDASMSLRSGVAEWIVSAAPTSFAIIDNTGGADDILFDLSSDAAGDSFVVGPVDSAGRAQVGIGTANPQGGLHISGTEAQDLFSGMGPDLINGPAFNYGYAGASFGRSAGFFNVRPDALAVAPNPSLRFFTANQARMIIDNQGFVGLSGSGGNSAFFDPVHPLQMASGAHVTAGGVWTNASSRALKNSIESLSPLVAMVALEQLEPVRYRYNADSEDEHLGFVAEDVPALVATPDRKGLAPMDVVSLLTKVVQVQQDQLESQTETIEALLERVEALEAATRE